MFNETGVTIDISIAVSTDIFCRKSAALFRKM